MKKVMTGIMIFLLMSPLVMSFKGLGEAPADPFDWLVQEVKDLKKKVKRLIDKMETVEQNIIDLFVLYTDVETELEDLEGQVNEFSELSQRIVILEDDEVGNPLGWNPPGTSFTIEDEEITEESVIAMHISTDSGTGNTVCQVSHIVSDEGFVVECTGEEASVEEGTRLHYVVFSVFE